MINPLELCLKLALNDNMFLSFFVICSTYYSIKFILFILPNRILRCINIVNNGYPPSHCDADGDLIKEYNEKD